MTTPRPVCVHCGKKYGSRSVRMEAVRWKEGEPQPEYRGNGIVIKERSWKAGRTAGTMHGTEFAAGDVVCYRDVWDGETWYGGYNPFCTLTCALDYARKQFRKYGPYRDRS